MRFDAGAGFTPAPEDDPLPPLASVPARTLDDLAFNLDGLKTARAEARAGLAGLAGGGGGFGAEAVAHLAARRRRVEDWTRVALEIAAEAKLYDPQVHTPEHGLARAARFVLLRASARRLGGLRPPARIARPMPPPAVRRAGS